VGGNTKKWGKRKIEREWRHSRNGKEKTKIKKGGGNKRIEREAFPF